MKSRCNYLIEITFLGFRFHGWAKQPGLKTVHDMIDRTLRFVLQHDNFKTMGSSRTDARVSARSFFVQLFMEQALNDFVEFILLLNHNLPADIRALNIKEVDTSFNLIQSPRWKEYHYFFYYGREKFPFAAPYMSYFPEELDLELMQQGALTFQGSHNFSRYVTQPSSGVQTRRTILRSEILNNDQIEGNFLPSRSYYLAIASSGFMRHQIRLMMGQLVRLGKGDITLLDLKETLENPVNERFDYIAPGSGLLLYQTRYED